MYPDPKKPPLSPAKTRLLALMRSGNAPLPKTEPTPPVQPLSSAQLAMWTAEKLSPGSSVNHFCVAFGLCGELDHGRLSTAIARIRERHPALRSILREINGLPYNVMAESESVSVEAIKPEGTLSDRALEISRALREPFDLAAGPLWRVRLLEEDDHHSVLIVVAHHIIVDHASFGIFLRELRELYNHAGSLAELSPPSRAIPNQDSIAAGIRYFKTSCFGAASFDFPADGLRTASLSREINTVRYEIAGLAFQKLNTLADAIKVSRFEAVFAAFQVAMRRFAGLDDFVVWVPVSTRGHIDSQEAIGCFINILPIRIDADLKAGFVQFCSVIAERVRQAASHRDTGLLDISGQGNTVPAEMRYLFSFLEATVTDLAINDTTCERIPVDRCTSAFEISAFVEHLQGRYEIIIEYNSRLYSREVMDSFCGSIHMLIDAITSDCRQNMENISMVADSRSERRRQTGRINHDIFPSVYSAVLRNSRAAPQSPAVIFENKRLSYEQLLHSANHLALELARRGIKAGDRVAILLSRSQWIPVAMLGILQAGAAFVPLDPKQPSARLRMILEDSQPTVLITERRLQPILADEWKDHAGLTYLEDYVMRLGEPLKKEECDEMEVGYVLYTSGSTGKPKGVEVRRRSLSNLLQSFSTYPGFEFRNAMLASTTISFDIAILENLLPLVTGGCVVMANDMEAGNPWELSRIINECGVSHIQGTPSLFGSLVEVGWRGNPQITIWCGGEALTATLAEKLQVCCASLFNLYGPTETTIWSSVAKIEAGDSIAIGQPIDNTSIYVVDRNRQVLPWGARGELAIAGLGVAKGYHARDELNARKFVQITIGGGKTSVFLTGDNGRWRGDGRLECFGRNDDQVKVRGFRIELSEIDAALLKVSSVVTCATVAIGRQDAPESYLAAAVVLRSPFDRKKITSQLRELIPEYMIPSEYVEYAQLPVTANGKIDRGLLKQSISKLSWPPMTERKPKNDTETQLLDLICEITGRPASVADDFFALGGDSLTAVRLLAEIQRMSGVQLSLQWFYKSPRSAESLAGAVEAARGADDAFAQLLAGIENTTDSEARSQLQALSETRLKTQ